MRVLFYTWVDYRHPARRGGGISQYQRVLMEAALREPALDPVFLCAGLAHRLRPRAPRWAPLPGGTAAEAGRRFQLVDSAPLAPAHHSFGDPAQVAHGPTEAAFAGFLAAHGPFDVVHFNTLEGLPARALAVAAQAGARVVLSLHNHYPFCPQVNLWRGEAAPCTDFEAGAACVGCLPVRRDPRWIRRLNAVVTALGRAGMGPGTRVHDRLLRPVARGGAQGVAGAARRLGALRPARARRAAPVPSAPVPSAPAAAAFAARRAAFVDLVNAHCDAVLAVSRSTERIARGFGVAPGRLRVLPIGTDQAAEWTRRPPPPRLPRPDGTLGLGFLGYARRDKGFFFLLDTLEGMEAGVLARLRLTLGVRLGTRGLRRRLARLAPRLAGLVHHDGYARGDLDAVLGQVDLGVVPPLWEDNLPQVALEMHARRIPLLVSDRGGARELVGDPALVFPAGDRAALAARLGRLVREGHDLTRHWRHAPAPVTPRAHVAALVACYRGLRAPAAGGLRQASDPATGAAGDG